MNATRWRIPPLSAAGRARSKPSSPNAAKCACAAARAPPRDVARHPQRQRRVVERATATAAARRAAASAPPAARRPTPASGAVQPAHQLEQRRLPAPARPDDRDELARAGRAGRRRRAPRRPRTPCGRRSTPHRSRKEAPVTGASTSVTIRSLRGHYPDRFEGSAPVRGAISAGRSSQPPCFQQLPNSVPGCGAPWPWTARARLEGPPVQRHQRLRRHPDRRLTAGA